MIRPQLRVYLTGNLSLGSQLYSQCLRDLQRLQASAKRNGRVFVPVVSGSPGGLLARRLCSGMGIRPEFSELPPKDVELHVVYIRDRETDAPYEELVNEHKSDASDVVVRAPAPPGPKRTLRQDPDPYGDFKKAFNLIERRIRPIPTRGPQIWREIEIRPNGGQPWFAL